MARKKQRENYGNGSVTPVNVKKLDKGGNPVIDPDTGKPVMVQERDKKGNLVWRVCLTSGTETYITKSGKTEKRQRKIQKRVHGTLADARKVMEQLRDDYADVDFDGAKDTVAEVIESWLSAMKCANTASKAVLTQYETWLGYVSDYFGDKKIIDIKKTDIEAAMASIKTQRNLSNTTMNKMFAVTKRLFEYAVDSDWLIRNPCAKVTAPRKDKVNTRKSLSSKEIARLRAVLDRDEEKAYHEFDAKEQRQAGHGNTFGRSCLRGLSGLSGLMAIRIMLATGVRRGEACGLTWGAVDFKQSQICIRQSLSAAVKIKHPKTDNGIRTLFVDAETMEHLKRWKQFQKKALHLVMKEGVPATQNDDTPVACSDIGDWLDPTNLGRWWSDYRETIGFPTLKMHELRHSQATLLLGSGVDVKTVQARLGHSKSSLTLDQYAHAIPANDKAAAELMGKIYGAPAQASAKISELEKKSA